MNVRKIVKKRKDKKEKKKNVRLKNYISALVT